MFAGHLGAALAIGRAERRVNVGAFVIAALFLDIVLWLFVLLGWESVTIPVNFASTHQPDFVLPFSHGLVASVMWSAAAATAAFVSFAPRGRPIACRRTHCLSRVLALGPRCARS